MTLEEFHKKRIITHKDLLELTEDQYNAIANAEPKPSHHKDYKMPYEQRMAQSLRMKEIWFRKKNPQD